jgi:hypothetical protein
MQKNIFVILDGGPFQSLLFKYICQKIILIIAMKKLHYLLLITLVILLNACDFTSNEREKVLSNLDGHWISRDYLITLDKTLSPQGVAEQMPFYATEILINNDNPQSIILINGQMETAVIPFKRTGDTLSLKLNQDPETEIIYNPTRKTLSFTDKSLKRTYTFIRADSSLIDKSLKPSVAFQAAVNKTVMEGNWNLVESDSIAAPLHFNRFGHINGWDKYLTYTLCINGDCAANEDGDIIVLNNKGTADQYGFRSKNDTITLYKLIQTNDPDEKPVFKNGEALLHLVRKK